MAVTVALDLTPRQLDTVRALLARCLPGTGAWVYGSRARWTSRPDSDLDLVVFAEPGQARAVSDLREAFDESDLPFRVDLFVWDEVPDAFRQEIEREHVALVGTGAHETSGGGGTVLTTLGTCAALKRETVHPADIPNSPYVGLEHIGEGTLHLMGYGSSNDVTSAKLRFRAGDTLFGKLRPYFRKVARAPFDGICSTEIWVVRSKTGVDQGFIHYCLASREFVDFVNSRTEGTRMPRATWQCASDYRISLPPLPEQRAIARVLGALDDKIELNRRMNETLEATARAIFRDWFVDFGPVRAKMEGREPYLPPGIWRLFPDALDDAGKPKGWTMGTLSDIARSPRRTISPADVFRHTPYIGLEHMPRRSIALTQWESAVKVTSDKLAFRAGEILFGKLRPYFHKVGVAPVDGICSTDIVVVVSQAPQLSAFTAVCLSSDGFVDYTDRTSTGTRMPRTSWRTMGQYRICLPSEDVAGAFQGLAQPLIDCIGANIHEASFLAQFRDLLIPKLISGQIRLRTDETSAGMDSANNRRVTAPSHDRRKPHPGRGRDVSGDGKAPCGP